MTQCIPSMLRCGVALLLAAAVLTTDVALLHDDSYLQWVKTFAEDEDALRHAFQHGESLSTGSLCSSTLWLAP